MEVGFMNNIKTDRESRPFGFRDKFGYLMGGISEDF
jgi:hypothetical protein